MNQRNKQGVPKKTICLLLTILLIMGAIPWGTISAAGIESGTLTDSAEHGTAVDMEPKEEDESTEIEEAEDPGILPVKREREFESAFAEVINVKEDNLGIGLDTRLFPLSGIKVKAAYTIDLSSVSASGTGYTYTANGSSVANPSVITFTTAANGHTYTITGSTTTKRIVVNSGVILNVTLNGVSIVTNWTATVPSSPFIVLGTGIINITLSGANVLTSGASSTTAGIYSAGLHVDPTATLTINGSAGDTLVATGAGYGAGIGGSYLSSSNLSLNNAGRIEINGGEVTARGNGASGAGIGGGYYGSPTTIEINGGEVTATGSAGIGSGLYSSNRGSITINDGTVTATGIGAYGGAGIGGGSGTHTYGGDSNTGSSGGTIIINSGTVTATGGSRAWCGAGIGGGGGNITISGGTVTAASGAADGMDIGRGAYIAPTSPTGSVVITGGSVYPTQGDTFVESPTNGSAYGAPDAVGMISYPGYSPGQLFSIVAGGTVSYYTYNANAHPDGNVYTWLAYPGVSADGATATTTPSVISAPATVVSASSSTAMLNGSYYLNNTYPVASAYFEYGTTTSYGSNEAITPVSGTTPGIHTNSVTVTGLSPGTTYHYRFVIVASGKVIPSADQTFTTPVVTPSVDAVHSVTSGTTATLFGIYDLNGGIFSSGIFEISTDGVTWITPTSSTTPVSIASAAGVTVATGQLTGGTTTPSIDLAGLTTGATYYYRFTVDNNIGSTTTPIQQFQVIYSNASMTLEPNLTPAGKKTASSGEAVEWVLTIDNTVTPTGTMVGTVLTRTAWPAGLSLKPGSVEVNGSPDPAGDAILTSGTPITASLAAGSQMTITFETDVTETTLNQALEIIMDANAAGFVTLTAGNTIYVEDGDLTYGNIGADIGLWNVPKRFDFGYTSVSNTAIAMPLNSNKYQPHTQANGFYTRVYDQRTVTSGWDLVVTVSDLENPQNTSDTLTGAAIEMNTSFEQVTVPNQGSEGITALPVGPNMPTGTGTTWNLMADGTTSYTIMSGGSGVSTGTWNVRIPLNSVRLHLPANIGTEGVYYEGKITWTLDVAP